MTAIIIYWIALLVWCAVVAYFVIFDVIPMITGKWKPKKGKGAPADESATPRHVPHQGFQSLKRGKELSVEDIVKGLSHE